MIEKLPSVSATMARSMDFVSQHPYLLAVPVVVAVYVWFVNSRRFDRLNAIRRKYGFTDDPKSYVHMTPEQAQEVERNLAEYEMPWLYEFAWLFDFLRVRHLSRCPRAVSGSIGSRPHRKGESIVTRLLTLAGSRPVALLRCRSSLATRAIS